MIMKNIVYFLFLLLICSCNSVDTEHTETSLTKRDKKHIIQAFINNVEAIRKGVSCHLEIELDSLPEPLPCYSDECFAFYAFYSDEKNELHAQTMPVFDYLNVNIEQLHYSADSLKCVALVTVGYEKKLIQHGVYGDGKQVYDGLPIIGIRDSTSHQFKIYPMNVTSFHGFPYRKQVARLLRKFYYNLKGSTPSTANIPYKYGINQPEFFETAYEFSWIDSLNLYWGETYMVPGGRRVPYRFYSNQDSTINKNLCE